MPLQNDFTTRIKRSAKPSTSFTQAHPGAKLTTTQFALTAEFWEPINV